MIDPTEDFANFQVQEPVWEANKTDTLNIIAPLKNMKSRLSEEPMKIKVRSKNSNLNKIKLKFRRDKVKSYNYGSSKTAAKINLFEANSPLNECAKYESEQDRDSPFKTGQESTSELPRQTAYFGLN